ncbi:MAG TPA: hypothetical protein VLF68_02660, partial [Candidatus Saccharimonadales bacterium]|nr:hypothetical protein [Candidatus Saccharimonadales bacterium]
MEFENISIRTVVSFALGIAAFLLFTYLLAWIKADVVYNLVLLGIAIFEIPKSFQELRKIKFKNFLSWELLVLLIGALCMTSLTFFSGQDKDAGLVFYDVHNIDSVFHLSLIGSLIHQFPPEHGGLAGVPLRGYHFFYDFLLASFSKFYHLSSLDLFFRFFPLFLSLLYGGAILALCRFLRLNKITSCIFLFLGFFAQNLIFLLPISFSSIEVYDAGIIQSLSNIIDPNVIVSLIFLFCIILLLFCVKNKKQIIPVSILLGVLPELKIYTAVIAFGALFVLAGLRILQKKDFSYAKVLVLSGVIAAAVYLPINYGAGSLLFAPFLIYRHFMESSIGFAKFQWALKYINYTDHHNYPRIAYLYGIAIFLFFIPTLGLRLFSLAFIPKLFKKNFYTPFTVFWLSLLGISLIIPTFFIQTQGPFVVVQFFWIMYVLLLLPTAIVLGNICGNSKIITTFVIAALVFFSLPTNYKLFLKFNTNPTVIDKNFVMLAAAAETLVHPQEHILVLNRLKEESIFQRIYDAYQGPLVSALTKRSVYIEPEGEIRSQTDIVSTRIQTVEQIAAISRSCGNAKK